MSETDHRNDAIYAQRQAGATFAAIARTFGLSVERVRQIVKRTHRRRQFSELLSVRAWNILANMGVLRREDAVEGITRADLIARIQTVELETIGAQRNCGVSTVHEIADLVGCPDRFKQRGTGVVRVVTRTP
jgi:lambda repressor-like predicted transcriptional regulator